MPPCDERPQSDRRLDAVAIATLIALIALAFWPVTRGGFVNWDDTDMVVRNPDLNPPRIASLAPYWLRPHLGLYIPLTYTLYGALAWIGGMNAITFHLAALLLHSASAIFVWLILRRLIATRASAWLGAAVFSVHPIQTEAAAWIASLNTILSGAFALAALWCYLEHSMRKASTRWLVAATALFILALLAKPSAMVVPLIAAAIEALLLRRPPQQWWRPITLWLALAVVFALIARAAQPAPAIAAPSPLRRLLVAADAITFYFHKLLIPRAFAIDYGRSPETATRIWPVLIVIAVLLSAWLLRRRLPALLIAAAIFILALLPVLGLVPFDFQKYSTVADRYAYLSMLGVALVVASLATRSLAVRIALLHCIGLLCVLSMLQSARWHDTYVLARHALRVNPHSLAAHKVLAATHAADGHASRAAKHYESAISLRPTDAEAHFNYANLLLRQHDYPRAIQQYAAARALRPRDVRILKNLGVALIGGGQLEAAEQVMRDGLHLAPDDRELLDNLRRLRDLRATTTPS